MSHRKGCIHHREAIVALAMGLLPADEASAVHTHLESCADCQELYQSLRQQEEQLTVQGDEAARSAQSLASAVVAGNAPGPAGTGRSAASRPRWLRRMTIAVSSARRATMAAAIVATAAGLFILSRPAGWHPSQPFAGVAQAAYSDVLQQMDRARSVRYTKTSLTDGEPPVVMQQMVLQGGRTRTVCDHDLIIIDDFATGDELSLNPKKKVANLAHHVQSDPVRLMNLPEWMKTLHERSGVYGGQESLDGRMVDVYKVDQPYEKTTIWTDPQTHLPVRIEKQILPCTDKDIRVPILSISQGDFGSARDDSTWTHTIGVWGPGIIDKKMTVTLSDFAWNIDLDESLFSLTPPPGYQVTERFEYDDSVSGQEALVQGLRLWAETSNGFFPENINMLADARPNLIRRYRGAGPSQEIYAQAVRMANTILNGMFFAQQLKLDNNWHYAGGSVRHGEADKPLAWWLDKNSRTWRVIYGDLRVSELPEEP